MQTLVRKLVHRILSYLKSNRENFVFGCVVAFVIFFVAFVHGLIPNLPSLFDYNRYGAIGCGAQNFVEIFHSNCPVTGGDVGRNYYTGLPAVLLGSFLQIILPIGSNWIFSIVGFMFITLSIFGMYKLTRLFKVSKYIALSGALLFLLAPKIISMHGFGGTYWGMLMLPFAMYFIWWLLSLGIGNNWKKLLFTLSSWSLLSIVMILNDGYSFVMYLMATGIILVAWAWNRWREQDVWLATVIYIFGALLAYHIYKLNAPLADSWASSLDQFRSSGVDLITLIYPYGGFWWTNLLGIGGGIKDLWGDAANAPTNYIGPLIIGLAITGIYLARKKLTRLGVALIITVSVSFVLSLGPSLKINSQHVTDPNAPGFVTKSPYRMPEEDAVMPLPTAQAYRLPGLKAMRATHRWHVLTILVLVVFSCLAIQLLIKHKKTKLAYILLTLLILQFMPNPFHLANKYRQLGDRVSNFQTEILDPLKRRLDIGDRVVYFPTARGDNDFLVNYITPETRTWSYNVGGDKAVAFSRLHYPPVITNLIGADKDADTINNKSGELMKSAIEGGYIDKVVIPKFGLKWNAQTWPPSIEQHLEDTKLAAISAQKAGLHVIEHKYFYIVSIENATTSS